MKKGIIYKATAPSGNAYIGRTIGPLVIRKQGHKQDAIRHDYAFSRAIRKYGVDGFEWEVIYENIPEDTLNMAEICAIYTFDTYYEGYNSTIGGEGFSGYRHTKEAKRNMSISRKAAKRTMSDENKKKLSERMTGEQNPAKRAEVRAKISKANRGLTRKGTPKTEEQKRARSKLMKGRFVGELNWNYGKTHSEETKRKISEAQIGLQVGEKNPMWGKKHPEKTKQRMSRIAIEREMSGKDNHFYGKKHTEKTKEKMRKPRTITKERKLLSFDEMDEVRRKYNSGKFSYRKLADKYGVTKTAISNVILVKTQRSKASLERYNKRKETKEKKK